MFLPSENLAASRSKWSKELGVGDSTRRLNLHAPALLVLDMQNDFLEAGGALPVWGGPAIIDGCLRLIDAFRHVKLPIFFTQHFCLEPRRHADTLGILATVPEDKNVLRPGTRGAALHELLRPDSDEPVISKHQYSAFYETPLATLLRVSGCTTVVISGVATNICCETTAHHAFFHGLEVVFCLDGTGGTSEEAHVATLRNIQLSYGRVATVEQVVASLERT